MPKRASDEELRADVDGLLDLIDWLGDQHWLLLDRRADGTRRRPPKVRAERFEAEQAGAGGRATGAAPKA